MFNVLLVSLEVRCPRWSALMPVFHRVTSQVIAIQCAQDRALTASTKGATVLAFYARKLK